MDTATVYTVRANQRGTDIDVGHFGCDRCHVGDCMCFLDARDYERQLIAEGHRRTSIWRGGSLLCSREHAEVVIARIEAAS